MDSLQTLEQLQAKLTRPLGTAAQTIDLFAALESDGYLTNQLKQLAKLSLLEVKYDSIRLTAEQIVIQEPIAAFGLVKADMKIIFSATPSGRLQAAVTVEGTESLLFKEMTWIRLTGPRLEAAVTEEGEGSISGHFQISLSIGDQLTVPFQTGIPLSEGTIVFSLEKSARPISYLRPFTGGIDPSWGFPQGLQEGLTIDMLTFEYDSANHKLQKVEGTISKASNWDIAGPIQIKNCTLQINIENPEDVPSWVYTFSGEIHVHDSILDIKGGGSEVDHSFHADIKPRADKPLTILSWIQWFSSSQGFGLGRDDTQVVSIQTHFGMDAKGSFSLTAHLEPSPVTVGTLLSISNLAVTARGDAYQMMLEVSGTALFENKEITVVLTGRLLGDQWELCGKVGKEQLRSLVPDALPWDQLDVDAQLCVKPNANLWAFKGKSHWKIAALDNIEVTAVAEIFRSDAGWSASLCGTWRYHGLELELCYRDNQYLIKWNGQDIAFDIQNKTIALPLEGYTLGKLVEEAVSWVKGIRLGVLSPWKQVLDEISLSGVQLKLSLNDSKIFVDSETFSLIYDPKASESKLTLKTKGLFGGDVEWDPSDPSTTPVFSKHATELFDLKLLALGQHLSFSKEPFSGVEEAINELEVMNRNLLGELPKVDPDAGWLIGTKLGILKNQDGTTFAAAKIIFNDPNLYGLKLKLDGPLAESFAGLEFEIMYQKVTDSIGVYQAEIVLPDSMRTWEFGAYTITLPAFALALFTNGDFKIDIGFPWNYDFSRSLTVQTIVPPGIPVIGSAGFYFNKLSGATSKRVPKLVDGEFKPVLEFGLGLRLGIGKEIQKGPLKAGFSVTVLGMLEGVFAYWHPPAESDEDPAMYYSLQGTAGIQGKLYGHVDLSLVKADVDVTVTLVTKLNYEAYEDLVIAVIAKVDVRVKVKIGRGRLKVKIKLSYSAHIHESFAIEASKKAPWDSVRSLTKGEEAGNDCPCDELPEEQTLDWSHLLPVPTSLENPAPAALEELTAYLTPVLSVSNIQRNMVGTSTAELHPVYVLLLCLPTLREPEAEEQPEIQISDFEKLCSKYFYWLLAAALPDKQSIEQLSSRSISKALICKIKKQLTCVTAIREQPWTPIPTSAIQSFLQTFFKIKVMEPQENAVEDTTFFPMVPELKLTISHSDSQHVKSYRFSDAALADQPYLIGLASQFKELVVHVQDEVADDPSGSRFAAMSEQVSIAEFVFNDYFVLLAQQLVESALEVLGEEEEMGPMRSDQNAQEIVEAIQALTGNNDFTVFQLFEQNQELSLTSGLPLRIVNGRHQIQPSETIGHIVNNVYQGAFTVTDLSEKVKDDQTLLKEGQVVSYPSENGEAVIVKRGDTMNTIANQFGITVDELITSAVLPPLVEGTKLPLPDFDYVLNTADFPAGRMTLRALAEKYHTTTQELASWAGNTSVKGLFAADAGTLNIGRLNSLKGSVLLERIQARSLYNISGMMSRFFLHGLRLPTAGLCVRHENGECLPIETNPDEMEQGLFVLTGQQFDIPASTDSFGFTLENTSNIEWIELVDQEGT